MNEDFNLAFKLVIGHEGGYTTDRADRGNWTSGTVGKGTLKGTKFGISAMAYPNLDIKSLTLEDAKDIYRRDYWNKASCDSLPEGLDYLVFDAAINHGIGNAARFLQGAVGAKVDGAIGPKTLEAVSRLPVGDTVTSFCYLRGLFYTALGTFPRYKKGWFRRLFEGHATALSMISGPITDAPEAEPVPACCEHEADDDFWRSISVDLQALAQRATGGPTNTSPLPN